MGVHGHQYMPMHGGVPLAQGEVLHHGECPCMRMGKWLEYHIAASLGTCVHYLHTGCCARSAPQGRSAG